MQNVINTNNINTNVSIGRSMDLCYNTYKHFKPHCYQSTVEVWYMWGVTLSLPSIYIIRKINVINKYVPTN